MNEKNEQKLKQSQVEIRDMKQAKVRLIRQMKEEAEKVRTWKMQKEKEVNKLKQSEQKQQSQIAKMTNLHSKQQNVLRRKMEDANMQIKRLKDVLDKQKANKKDKVLGMLYIFCKLFITSVSEFDVEPEKLSVVCLISITSFFFEVP